MRLPESTLPSAKAFRHITHLTPDGLGLLSSCKDKISVTLFYPQVFQGLLGCCFAFKTFKKKCNKQVQM